MLNAASRIIRSCLAAATIVTAAIAAEPSRTIDLGLTKVTFSAPAEYVIHPDGGATVKLQPGLQLTAISTATKDRGGAQWNPRAGHKGYGGRGSKDQGWDSLLAAKNGDRTYKAELNVAPTATGKPYPVPGEGSLVIGIPNPKTQDVKGKKAYRLQIGEAPNEFYRVINFSEALPAPGSFRGAVRGPVEVRPSWTQATVRRNLDKYFPHDKELAESFPREDALKLLARVKAMASAGISWCFFAADSMQPGAGWSCYGRTWASCLGHCLINLRNTALKPEERLELADAIVQLGIDHYGIVRDGGYWQMNGGWTHGRIWVVDIAGLLLEDAYVRNAANNPLDGEIEAGRKLIVYPFTEQRQFMPVTKTAYTRGTDPSSNGGQIAHGAKPGAVVEVRARLYNEAGYGSWSAVLKGDKADCIFGQAIVPD